MREEDVRAVHENERRDKNVQVLYENVRVSGANEVSVPANLMNVGGGLMNARTNVNFNEQTVHAEVHAVSPSDGGSTVSRGISPFDGQVEVLAAHYVGTMTAATAGITTTSTSLPHFGQPRTDLLCMITTAHANMAIRDPNARGPMYVKVVQRKMSFFNTAYFFPPETDFEYIP